MADFCNQCAKMYGLPTGDLKGLTPKKEWRRGNAAVALCEGCGHIQVSPSGKCVTRECGGDHRLSRKGRVRKGDETDGR